LTKTLQDYAEESKRAGEQERGKKDFYQPPNGQEARLRILEWPGSIPCWVEGHVHYVPAGDSTKVLVCGEDDCYTCQRLGELAHSEDKSDIQFVRDASRKRKVYMYIIDWDDRAKGPQLFEPKDTQNCGTWSALINLFSKPDEYGASVFQFEHGLLINLLIIKEPRSIRGGVQDVNIQKGFSTSRNEFPIKIKKNPDGSYYQDPEGNFVIGVPMPDKRIQTFKLPDLGKALGNYDEAYHMEVWGDTEGAGEGGEYVDDAAYAGADDGFGGTEEVSAGGGAEDWENAGTETVETEPADPPFDGGDGGGEWGGDSGGAGEWDGDGAAEVATDPPPPPPPPKRPPAKPAGKTAPPAAKTPPKRPPAKPPAKPATGGKKTPPRRPPAKKK